MVKKKNKWLALPITVALLAGLAGPASSVITNTVDGTIGGVPATLDLANNNISFVLGSFKLQKRAYTSDWVPLGVGATVGKGSLIWFVIYVNNFSAAILDDIRIKDIVTPAEFEVVKWDFVDIANPGVGSHLQARDTNGIAENGEIAVIDTYGTPAGWTDVTDAAGDNASTKSPSNPGGYSINAGMYDGASQTFMIGTYDVLVESAKAQVDKNNLRSYRFKVRVK